MTPAVRGGSRLRTGAFLIAVLAVMTATAIPMKDTVVPSRYHLDKLVHVGMFTMLAVLGRRAVTMRTMLFCAGAVALLSEFQQWFIPGRSCGLLDLTANLAGIGLGVAVSGRRLVGREHSAGGAP